MFANCRHDVHKRKIERFDSRLMIIPRHSCDSALYTIKESSNGVTIYDEHLYDVTIRICITSVALRRTHQCRNLLFLPLLFSIPLFPNLPSGSYYFMYSVMEPICSIYETFFQIFFLLPFLPSRIQFLCL